MFGRLAGWALGGLVLGAAASAQAALITTAEGRGADATLLGGVSQDGNFGDRTLLEVHSSFRGATGYSILRFDLGGVTAPIQGAELLLTAAGVGDATINVAGLNDDASGQNWDEDTVTWNNAPGLATTVFDAATTTFLGSFGPISYRGSAGFTASALLDFVNADTDGLITFLLGSRFMNDDGFYAAKEHRTLAAPTLNLTLAEQSATSVPEPATLALFGLGLLGAGVVAGRRPRAPGGRRTTCPRTKAVA